VQESENARCNAYVITEALKVLFKRDDEFKSWLGQQPRDGKIHELKGG
jgi:hypothetical protein